MGSAIASESTQIVQAEKKLDLILSENSEIKARYDELVLDHKRATDAEEELLNTRAQLASERKHVVELEAQLKENADSQGAITNSKVVELEARVKELVLENERLRIFEERAAVLKPRVQALVNKISMATESKVPAFPENMAAPRVKRRRPPPPPPPPLMAESASSSDCEPGSSSDELDVSFEPMRRSMML